MFLLSTTTIGGRDALWKGRAAGVDHGWSELAECGQAASDRRIQTSVRSKRPDGVHNLHLVARSVAEALSCAPAIRSTSRRPHVSSGRDARRPKPRAIFDQIRWSQTCGSEACPSRGRRCFRAQVVDVTPRCPQRCRLRSTGRERPREGRAFHPVRPHVRGRLGCSRQCSKVPE